MQSSRNSLLRFRRFRKGGAHGFTLLEMMLVVVIIGLLAAVAVFNVVGMGKKARVGATKASLGNIANFLAAYHTDNGAYPPTLAILVPTYTQKLAKDGWKHDFVYFPASTDPGRAYSLFSMGEDGIAGNADDINYWTMDDAN
jgi:general secretion pathway protein G